MKNCLLLILLTVAICAHAQDKKNDKGHCFDDGTVYKDVKYNKLIAEQLSQIKKLGQGLTGTKATYTGNHIVFSGYMFIKNALGEITRRCQCVQAAFENSKGECTIVGYLAVEEAYGAGSFSEPTLVEYLNNGGTRCANGIGYLEKKWKSCECVKESKNWLKENSKEKDEEKTEE